ncbi:MAG: STAS domain-containing protein [Planctomycetes bacterium]|nr:STAS domain-containing protein [Planctomycetota bacterium]
MSVSSFDYPDYRLVKITGFLDGHTSESIDLLEVLGVNSTEIPCDTVLDLSAVEYVNSSILGLFVRFLSEAEKAGFKVVILAPPSSVRNVLELTGLSHVLPVAADSSEIASCLGQDGAVKISDKQVDYEELADELENIIINGSKPGSDSQLGKIIGS